MEILLTWPLQGLVSGAGGGSRYWWRWPSKGSNTAARWGFLFEVWSQHILGSCLQRTWRKQKECHRMPPAKAILPVAPSAQQCRQSFRAQPVSELDGLCGLLYLMGQLVPAPRYWDYYLPYKIHYSDMAWWELLLSILQKVVVPTHKQQIKAT